MSAFQCPGICALGVCLLLFLASPMMAQDSPSAEPVVLNIPESALKSGLLTAHVEQVSQAVRYWLDRLGDANSDSEILAARKGLMADYNRYDSMKYQYVFAEQVAKGIGDLLKLEDLRKQINTGLVVSQIRQVPVQPALNAMLTHPNPALRLYAWQGYLRIRLLVLAQGKDYAETMYAALAKAASTEESPLVLGEAFGMFSIDSDPPRSMTAQDFEQARKRMLAILQGIWPGLCDRVGDGDAEMITCCRGGIAALRNVHDTLAADNVSSATILPMVYAMMWSAAKTLTGVEPDSPVGAALEPLLQDCENALNYVTKARKSPMTAAMSIKDPIDRGLAVLSAVQAWRETLIAGGYELDESGTAPEPSATPGTPPAGT